MKNFIIPSIDLLDGKVVRLLKGDYEKTTFYNISIDDLLKKYNIFETLHIVNLNGAKGEKCEDNEKKTQKIRQKFRGKIQVGGGFRDVEKIDFYLNKLNVDAVVLGTLCIKNIEKTIEIIKKFGAEKIVLAIDCENINGVYAPKINGWQEFCDCENIFNLLKKYYGIAQKILITDIQRDGCLSGGNCILYQQIKTQFPNFQIQASGGVCNFEDVKKLQEITDFAIVGRAMYENNLYQEIVKFDENENQKENQNGWKNADFVDKIDWKKCNNLVPCIVQDCKTFDVLMLGFCNKEAIKLTQQTGKMHFFSRTKNRIWMKGEESGNVLKVEKLLLDCDNDALLAVVEPTGSTCHTGTKTCFNERVNFLAELEEIIDERLKNNDCEASYVAKLSAKGLNKVAQKVGEEATEVVISALAESDERFLSESADSLFHFLLLLKNKNFELKDVVKVLEERHKEKIK